ncbi:hypothetical protein MYX64_08180 [Nitrospinae bacterium AH_259_B05_G02_I21]|nr:hypothetical protein [Nitrospinae bacterium AH_259_B05_G02_I21]
MALAMGFLTLLASNFAPTVSFGYLSAIVMIVALCADLVLTPVLLQATQLISIWDVVMIKISLEVLQKSPLFQDFRRGEAKRVVLLGEVRTYASGYVRQTQPYQG